MSLSTSAVLSTSTIISFTTESTITPILPLDVDFDNDYTPIILINNNDEKNESYVKIIESYIDIFRITDFSSISIKRFYIII